MDTRLNAVIVTYISKWQGCTSNSLAFLECYRSRPRSVDLHAQLVALVRCVGTLRAHRVHWYRHGCAPSVCKLHAKLRARQELFRMDCCA